MKGGGSLCMATYSLVSYGVVISTSHGRPRGERMRTLLLAALDAIVVVEVLSVVGLRVGEMWVGGWGDGVVRYQGGCCPRHGP